MLPVKYLGNSKIKSEMLIEEFCHLTFSSPTNALVEFIKTRLKLILF